jgi:cell division protein FtsB
MIDYQKLVRNWRSYGLTEGEAPSLKSYLQSITEILSKLNLSSKSDQRRVEIARQHIKEVKKYTRKLEERVSVLEEQVQMLEEKTLKVVEEGIGMSVLVSYSGDTPEDVASDMKATMDITALTPDNFSDIVGKYLMQAGVLDDDWPDWQDAVWVALTDGESEF